MNTTNLFVELLVIGLGPVVAIAMLVDVALGPSAASTIVPLDGAASIAILLPALGLMYVVGIITDRFADRMLSRWSKKIRRSYFDTDDEYHLARRTIIVTSDVMYGLRQYGRSRMRIARGWTLNGVLLLLVANVWLAAEDQAFGVTWVANGTVLFLLLGSLYSWRSLAHSEYEKIRGGAAFARGQPPR